MSLIALLTGTDPVALEKSLEDTRFTTKGDCDPKVCPPHLKWWLQEIYVLQGQPLHILSHALQIFTDASRKGWETLIGDLTAKATWSFPESKLHLNYLELKAFFLALKKFKHLFKQDCTHSN